MRKMPDLPELTLRELSTLRGLSSPARIQDFVNELAINHEKREETCRSPRGVLENGKAHCLEGAALAAAALWLHGEPPVLMELSAAPKDQHHAVALFKRNGYWGAISKSNHASLRFRDPIYRTVRELAISYFHEYFLNDSGKKTLRGYTRPFSLARFGTGWVTSENGLWDIAYALRDAAHLPIVPEENMRYLRPADPLERKAGRLIDWPKSDPRT